MWRRMCHLDAGGLLWSGRKWPQWVAMGVGVRTVSGGPGGAQPQLPGEIPPISEADTAAKYTVQFFYLICARKHLVTRHVCDNNFEHEAGERTQVYLGPWAALKLLCWIGAIQTSHQCYKAWRERPPSAHWTHSLRLWWRNNFAIDMFRKSFHKVTNGFWCKMGLVSIKSQSGVYWAAVWCDKNRLVASPCRHLPVVFQQNCFAASWHVNYSGIAVCRNLTKS